MERLALDTNALLTASLTEKLEDEHYRTTTVAYALEKTAAGRRYHALERHRARVAFQRVKFDCQVAMVMQLRGQWVFAVSEVRLCCAMLHARRRGDGRTASVRSRPSRTHASSSNGLPKVRAYSSHARARSNFFFGRRRCTRPYALRQTH